MSALEEALALQLRACGINHVREYRFAMEHIGAGKALRARLKEADLKDWRFDFILPGLMIAIEVEGGIHINGRHNRGVGFQGDLDKYDAAMRLGWTVYRCSGAMIKSGKALQTIEILIKQHGG